MSSSTAISRINRVISQLNLNLTSSNNTHNNHNHTTNPVKVVVTGAAGNIAYSLLFMIAQGKLLGDSQPIELRLLGNFITLL